MYKQDCFQSGRERTRDQCHDVNVATTTNNDVNKDGGVETVHPPLLGATLSGSVEVVAFVEGVTTTSVFLGAVINCQERHYLMCNFTN